MFIGSLALTAAALFTGTAFYVGSAEQASRLGLDDRALLAEWKSSYRRGSKMAVPLVILDFFSERRHGGRAAARRFLLARC